MNSKIKIVLLIDVLENINGGAERQVYELIKGINKEKFAVSLYILHQKEAPEEIKALDCEVRGIGIKRIYSFNGIWKGSKFANDIKEWKTDILMTYHFGSDIWGTVFAKLAGVQLIISNRRDEGFLRKKIHISAYKFVNRWVNKITVVSNAVKKIVIESENVKPEKIEVIHNGVDVKRFETAPDIFKKREELNLTSDSPVIGCVGNLRTVKGQKYLIEAAVKVLQRFSDTQFLFVGTGELKDTLLSQAKKLNIENNIKFLGQRCDISELLSIMDVCVLPSLSEGLSNALLEYMAAGKPIISTRVGGNVELITHKEEGLLVDSADSYALAEAIISLLDYKELRQRFGYAAKRKALENYTIQKMIQEYEHLLETPFISKTKKEIRILHLISSNGLFGAEKVILSLASNMNYNGLKSWIAAVKNSHNPHLEIIDGAKVKGLPAEIIESRGKFDIRSVSQLVRLIKENNISIIHTHNIKANFLGFLAAKKTKIPIVATNHLWTHSDLKLRIYEFIDGFILNSFANLIIAVSNNIKEDMIRRGMLKSKIEVIPNGIEAKDISTVNKHNLKNEYGIKDTTIAIGVIARLSPEKGHKYLLEALVKVLRDMKDIIVFIVGDGTLRQSLQEQVENLGIKKWVVFTGYRTDMEKVYSGIDILVQPSLREGLPITILEAMSYGKAIVATNVGGIPDLIKRGGFTGLLVNSGSSEAIYKALLAYILQPDLRKRLGENAKQFVRENYSLEKMVDSYKKVYEDTICNSKAAFTG